MDLKYAEQILGESLTELSREEKDDAVLFATLYERVSPAEQMALKLTRKYRRHFPDATPDELIAQYEKDMREERRTQLITNVRRRKR